MPCRQRPPAAPARRLRRRLALVALGLWQSAPQAGRAADPLAYQVSIGPTHQAPLDAAVHDSATLISLAHGTPIGPFALIARARADRARFRAALESYGYYKGSVAITIAGRPLDDPSLTATLAAMPAGAKVPVLVSLTLGPLFHLRHIAITGDAPGDVRDKLGLKPGQPALAADVLGGQGRLLDALQEDGHALAKVADPVVTEDAAADVLDVTYPVTAGPRIDLGPIALTGLKRTNPAFVQKHVKVQQGQPYSPSAIEQTRRDLAGLGIFSGVSANAASSTDAAGQLPITYALTEAPRHAVTLGASYSTDLGGDLSASWTARNVFGNGEQFTFTAQATELGGSDALLPGYIIGPQYSIPDWLRPDQTLTFTANAIQQYLFTYNQIAAVASAVVTRQISPQLTASLGVAAEQESIFQQGVTTLYTLFSLPATLKYDTTNNLLEPTRGLRAALSVTPTDSVGGRGGNLPFALVQGQASTYLDLSGNGRSIIALRALAGVAPGASEFDVPADQRFYAGGSGTVRGYTYQYAGPQFPDGVPEGGIAIDAGTIEFRQRIGASYGAVAFLDVAQVSAAGSSFAAPIDPGVGVGARYFTSFGPIRLDFAIPLRQVQGNNSFEVYVGLGEAF